MDVDGDEEALDLNGGIEGGGGGEEDAVEVGVMELNDGALAEAVIGGEELGAGLEDVEVGGVERENDVALEGGGGRLGGVG